MFFRNIFLKFLMFLWIPCFFGRRWHMASHGIPMAQILLPLGRIRYGWRCITCVRCVIYSFGYYVCALCTYGRYTSAHLINPLHRPFPCHENPYANIVHKGIVFSMKNNVHEAIWKGCPPEAVWKHFQWDAIWKTTHEKTYYVTSLRKYALGRRPWISHHKDS